MADTPIGPGTVLAGRFTLEDLLDDTSGARFWLAIDQTLARRVAVHVLSDDDPRSDALLSAARTSATVTDGHLLRVLDAAREDGLVYVVNEWGSGMSLDRILHEEGPLSPRRAAWVVKEAAEAISTAHRHGVAHGRLLPENVMVSEAGSVKLIGFVVDAVLRGRARTRVIDGNPIEEHEADVVNLAALLYACLVGKWPGTAGSRVPVAPSEHGKALRPRQVRAGVPRPLDTICDRVLSPGANGHHPPIETAHEIYAALADYIGDPTGSTQLGYEQTSLIDEQERLGHQAGAPTQVHPAPQDPGSSGRAAEAAGAGDAERTQAGVPVFYDETTGVGWVPGAARKGLPGTQDEPGTQREPPPPPELPEPEPKPLFAPGPSAAAASQPRSTGPGNGVLPDTWGPDATGVEPEEDEEWGTASWRDDPPGRSWMRLAVVVAGCVVLIIGIVAAFNLGRGSGPDQPPVVASTGQGSPSPSATPIHINSVTDFDPQGHPPREHPDQARLAIDGDPSTAWTTVTYFGNPKLGGLKTGVGLLVDLGSAKQVGEVSLTLGGSPTAVTILAAPHATTPPSSTDTMQTVAHDDNAGTQVSLHLDQPVRTRYLAVWLTSLPRSSGGYQGRIAEIDVTSP
ncbi:MAG: protein kinase family protein [Nocardioidaceae bacterium]